MKLIFNEEYGKISLLDPLQNTGPKGLECRLQENKFLGFNVLQSSAEISKGMQELIENPFLLTRLNHEQLIVIVKIKNRLERLWIALSSLDSFDILDEPTKKSYRVVKGSKLGPYNQSLPYRKVLLDMRGKDTGVVVAYGDFNPELTDKQLLCTYRLKSESIPEVADDFRELLALLSQWWTRYAKRGLVLRVPKHSSH